VLCDKDTHTFLCGCSPRLFDCRMNFPYLIVGIPSMFTVKYLLLQLFRKHEAKKIYTFIYNTNVIAHFAHTYIS